MPSDLLLLLLDAPEPASRSQPHRTGASQSNTFTAAAPRGRRHVRKQNYNSRRTHWTRTAVCPAFCEQLSVFWPRSTRGRRRFRKLKRASRLKLLLEAELLLVGGALSRPPSAPSARSPAHRRAVIGQRDGDALRDLRGVSSCVHRVHVKK